MDSLNQNRDTYINAEIIDSQTGTRGIAKSFMANVFLWMFAALAISALLAYLFSSSI